MTSSAADSQAEAQLVHPLAERRGGAKAAGVAAARTQDV